MNFNVKQSKEIYEFIMKYNSDEGFKSNIQNLYNKEISKLSILHIYALEEILRYGTKGIFNKFVDIKGTYTEDLAVDLFDGFIKLLNKVPTCISVSIVLIFPASNFLFSRIIFNI